MSAKTIAIGPITRLEDHGKMEILKKKGNVENAYFQIPELGGFERFCEGRRAEDMPILAPRICGPRACLACATHFEIGQMRLQVNICSHDRKLLKTIGR